MNYITRITRLTVGPEREPLYSERCTHVEIVDEAAGELIEVRQQSGHVKADGQTIQIDPAEWPALREAIDRMVKECRKEGE
jgi:hypothetical protein